MPRVMPIAQNSLQPERHLQTQLAGAMAYLMKEQQATYLIHKASSASLSSLGQCRHAPAPAAAAPMLVPPLPPAALMASLPALPRWRQRRRCRSAPGHPLRRGRWRAAADAPPPCCLHTHAAHCGTLAVQHAPAATAGATDRSINLSCLAESCAPGTGRGAAADERRLHRCCLRGPAP